jgi:hypothetical protein
MYSSYSLNHERLVLSNYKSTLQPYLSDDFAFDLKRILDLDLDMNVSSSEIDIFISSSLSKGFNFSQKLSDYESFLNNTYFDNISGTQSINFNSDDGVIELFFGNDYEYLYDFDNNSFSFISNSDVLNSIDLNMDYAGSDLNTIIEPLTSGSSIMNISYVDDTNSFSETYEFDPSVVNTIIFIYNGDYNIAVTFGNTGSENSLLLDSNSVNQLDYSFALNYSFDSIELPVYFNTILSHSEDRVDSNSFLKIRN